MVFRGWIRSVLPTLLVVGLLILSCNSYTAGPDKWIPATERENLDLSGTFQTLGGDSVELDDLRDKVLFLNVWATWCGPCREEMPSIEQLHQELSDEGLSVVAVTTEDAETVMDFLEDRSFTFHFLLDPEEITIRNFGVLGLPTSFIIDREGRVASVHTGAYHWDSEEMIQKFRDLLAQ